jgi:hypothetical protein
MLAAFDAVFDHALVFHGYADYARDYDAFIHLIADLGGNTEPARLRYRFNHCVRAVVTGTGQDVPRGGDRDERAQHPAGLLGSGR